MNGTDKLYFAVVGLAVTLLTPLLVALVNHATQLRQANRDRRKERITDQIQKLYGRLMFYADMNLHYYNRYKSLGDSYMGMQAGTSGLDAKYELTNVGDVLAVIERKIAANNAALIKLIEDNSAFIHLDDFQLFRQFVSDYSRPTVEEGIPWKMIAWDVRPPWEQPDTWQRITDRFAELSNELDGLSGASARKHKGQIHN